MNSALPAAGHDKSVTSAPALLPVYTHIEYPFELVRGEGVYVFDTKGRRYLDFYGGHCVCCIGHSPKELVDAISQQAAELLFYSNLAPLPIRTKAAERLVSFAANGFTRAFFCNSGAEANENALKIAIKASGRSKIVAFDGSFHGRTMLALGATHNPAWHKTFGAWIGDVERIKPNDFAAISSVDNSVAAVILEPIQSIGGVTEFELPYLKALREACNKYGVYLIFDEVQTGIGRTGVPFVSGHFGVLPDMMTLAKGLAGGFPAGAVVMTEAVAQTISPGDIAATFGGNPLAMAALIATLDTVEKKDLQRNATNIEEEVRRTFSVPYVEAVRGRGCLLGLVLTKEAKPVQKALFEKGIITGTNANPKLLHLLPPLTIEEKHVRELRTALDELFSA